jgi:hypothetical protein
MRTTNSVIGSVTTGQAQSTSAVVKQIYNFSWQHLKAATTFRHQVNALETANQGKPFGAFFEDIRSYCSATILSATAALEAFINERFLAHNELLRSKLSNFEVEFWGNANGNGNKGIEQLPILEKYKHALKLLDSAHFSAQSKAYSNALALIELRNALVHYKPTWDPDRKRKIDAIALLKNKYGLSPFINGNGDFITMQSMSAGCAEWAVKTIFEFLHEFNNLATQNKDVMASFWALEQSRP